jgi:hypothetical protein
MIVIRRLSGYKLPEYKVGGLIRLSLLTSAVQMLLYISQAVNYTATTESRTLYRQWLASKITISDVC